MVLVDSAWGELHLQQHSPFFCVWALIQSIWDLEDEAATFEGGDPDPEAEEDEGEHGEEDEAAAAQVGLVLQDDLTETVSPTRTSMFATRDTYAKSGIVSDASFTDRRAKSLMTVPRMSTARSWMRLLPRTMMRNLWHVHT